LRRAAVSIQVGNGSDAMDSVVYTNGAVNVSAWPAMKPPSACHVCGLEVKGGTWFKKVLFSRDEQVARKLAEEKGDVYLCPKCWRDDAKRYSRDELESALMALSNNGMVQEIADAVWRTSTGANVASTLIGPVSSGLNAIVYDGTTGVPAAKADVVEAL